MSGGGWTPRPPVDVYLGIDRSGHAARGACWPCHRRLVPVQKDLPSGAGFAVRPHAVKDDAKEIVNLGVFCTDAACEDIFLHFMEDLVSHLLVESGPEAAVRTFLARVGLWQRFFVAGGGVYLSEESQCGLFAELLLLRDLVIPTVGRVRRRGCLEGPRGQPAGLRAAAVRAGGEVQPGQGRGQDPDLQRAAARRAALPAPGPRPRRRGRWAAAATRRWRTSSQTVRALLATRAGRSSVFNDRLITAGWIDAHAAQYSENRFFVREVHYFEVRDDFPRIRPGDFRRASWISPTSSTRRR